MLWFRKKEKTALDAAVRSAGKPATELIVEEAVPQGHVFPATATHFGGNPYFEQGDTWPTVAEDGRPFDFVCQVNLQDCPERPIVPFDLFTVFLCWAMAESEEVERACMVRAYKNASTSKAVSISQPAPLAALDYRVRPCALRTQTFMTYPPWPVERLPEVATAASRFRNPAAAYGRSLGRLGFRHDFRSRVGGFPTWVQETTFHDDEFIFLAQIDYEPQANNCIGDAAPIYIAASASDPTRIETDIFQSF